MATLVAGLFGLTRCADPASATGAMQNTSSPIAYSRDASPGSALDVVTRVLALGLRDPRTRLELKTALRASRLLEHKLELHTFFATPVGRTVLVAGAAATGLSADSVLAFAGQLPALDLYLPRREHRRTWAGAAPVMVAAFLAREPGREDIVFYDANGHAKTAEFAEMRNVDPNRPLLLLHPADPHFLRTGVTVGSAVEDEKETSEQRASAVPRGTDAASGAGASAMHPQSSAPTATYEAVTYDEGSGCDSQTAIVECGGGYGGGEPVYGSGPTGATSGPRIVIVDFVSIHECDHGPFACDANEWEMKTWNNGANEAKTPFNADPFDHLRGITIRNEIPTAGHTIRVELWESDNGGDDKYWEQNFTTSYAPIAPPGSYISGDFACGYGYGPYINWCQNNGIPSGPFDNIRWYSTNTSIGYLQ